MRRQGTHWTITLQRAVAASIAVAIALIVSTWMSQQSSQADLRLAVEELRARAGEMATLAREFEQRRLTPTAARVAARQLESRLADTRNQLAELQRDMPSTHAARAVEAANRLAMNADALASQDDASTRAPLSQQAHGALQTLLALETELRPK